jgi:hypothetical protein
MAASGNVPGTGSLRYGGVDLPNVPSPTTANLPSTRSKAVERQASALQMVRDLWSGTETVRERRTAYLPQDPGEDAADYQARLHRSVFFNVFRATVEGLTGFIFAKDPTLGEDVPPAIAGTGDLETGRSGGHWENIDNAGTHGDVFVRELTTDALIAGHAGILVDYPDTGGERLTLADEQARKVRPYWVPIKKDAIVSWRTAVIDGRTILTQLVLEECAMVPDGAFGEKEQTRYRVLYRNVVTGVIGFVLLEVTEKKEVVQVGDGLYRNQVEIPFAEVVTSGKRSFLESDPPLIDLGYLNVAHYQGWSDAANSRHKTCVPVFFTAGVVPAGEHATLIIGPNMGINASDPTAKAEYVTHSGESLDACKIALDDLKSDMAVMGLAMLAPQKRSAETAEAKRIDKATTDSKLAVTSRGVQDGVERALGFHARYLLLEDGGSVQINREFEDQSMPPDLMTAWATLAEKLDIPVRLVLEALQEGGRIAASADLDAIEDEIYAAAAARQAEEQQAAADAHAMQMEAKGLAKPVAA